MDSISLLTVLVRIVGCSHSPHLPLHLNPHPHSSLLSPHHHLHTQHTDFWLSSKIFRYKYNTAWATPCFAILQSVCRIMVTLARTRICIFIIYLIRKFLYLGNIGLFNTNRIPGPHTERCEPPICTGGRYILGGRKIFKDKTWGLPCV